MNNCHQCHAELEKGKPFCTNCGAEVQGKKQRSNKKKRAAWLLGGSGILLLIVLAGGYWYGKERNNPVKLAKQFEQAVSSKDSEDVASILKVTEKQAKWMLNEETQGLDFMKEEMDQLMQQADDADAGNPSYQEQAFSIKASGKEWFLFDTYTIKAEPVYIRVSANKDIQVAINGEKQGTLKEEEEKTFGPFLPGSHTIQAIYKGAYAELKEEQKLNSFEAKEETLSAEFDMTGNQVYLSSNNEDAELYLNGKNTGLKISQASPFGPVAVDGSAKLQAVSGSQKSNIETVTAAEEDIELLFDEDKMAVGSADAEKMVIRNTVENHYSLISKGHYQAAYDLLSSARQTKNKFANWSAGLKNNFKNEITYMEITEVSPEKAVVSFTLDSYDTQEDGFTKVQTWGGKWHLLFEGGWKLDNPEIKKLGSRIE
ncbi:hypothetical protein GKZ89_14245 [Bacillus mangrovi]|uniref:Zinc-ribbon domain-containing protein n=1 Tax=Metabacillus mangrovi TaxID=1491830 RepID=A0A7X2S859_9BACI|nr:hypothetical protein [Metabacillus mangrovi]MTH54561.1 hypothetical protein [Metabacillus mangrovi]